MTDQEREALEDWDYKPLSDRTKREWGLLR